MDSNIFSKHLKNNQTEAEKLLWYKLRNRRFFNIKFRRQQSIGNYIVDFVSLEKKLIIELDGGQHNIERVKQRDINRTKWLENQGFTILRFWNGEILKNMDGVLESIRLFAYKAPHPNPLPQGEREIKDL